MAAGWRNALAAVGVLAALAALVAVPAAVDGMLPTAGPLPPGNRLEVGYGVTLRPPPGARQDLAASRPGKGEVVLLTHGLRITVTAAQVRERPSEYVSHARYKLHRDKGFGVGEPVEVRTADGVRGQRADLRVVGGSRAGAPGCASIFTAETAGAVVVISPVRDCVVVPIPVWTAVMSLTFTRLEER